MVKVRRSAVVDVPIEALWAVLRDFNSHGRWHPAIAESVIEEGREADEVGAVRRFSLVDGGLLREQLLSLDDETRSFSYCLLEAPLPLMNYVAQVRLRPVTDSGKTYWEWESRFDPPPGRRDDLAALVGKDIYEAGIRALERYLNDDGRYVVARAPEPPPAREVPGVPPERPMPRPPEIPGGSAVPGSVDAKAIVAERHGGPEVMRLQTVAVPPPGPGEVRIRQSFIGVNFIDVYCRTGYFDLLHPPGVPGMEAAGTVDAVGEGVSHLSVGDRVAYACPPVGAYADLRTMAADLVVRIPSGVSEEIAAAALLKGVSAGFLLHDVHRLRAGETVLIHAGAGGVGSLLVQWAAALGARVIATVSTEEKAVIAARNGAHEVVVHAREDFVEAVAEITRGRGADVIYDAIGRDTFDRSIEALAVRGHLVSFGQASGDIGARDIGGLASKSVTLSRPNYGHYTATREEMGFQADRLFDALARGLVTIEPPTRYALAEAADAHRDLEARRTTGSVVLVAQGGAG